MKILYKPDEAVGGGHSFSTGKPVDEPIVEEVYIPELDPDAPVEEPVVEEPVVETEVEEAVAEEPVVEEPVVEEPPEHPVDFTDLAHLKGVLLDGKVVLEDVCLGNLRDVLLSADGRGLKGHDELGEFLRSNYPLRKYNRLVGCGINEKVLSLFF